MTRRARRVMVLLLLLPATRASAQHVHDTTGVVNESEPAVADFVRRARAEAARYADQAVAVADGYRRLGPDFPAMGEHWANPELVARGVLDPARPPLLTYIRVSGVPRLTGVVYALPLGDGETPPPSPFPPGAWHDHFGSVEDESLLLNHDAQRAPAGELRLAVLHVWLFVRNPAGAFTTDNWALPWVRLGVAVPADAPAAATRAAALATGSLPYYVAMAERAMGDDAAERERTAGVLGRHSEAIMRWWAQRPAGAQPGPTDLAELAARWRGCWAEAAHGASPGAAARLQAIADSP